MDNLNDLKTIWLSAKTDALPTPQQVVKQGKKFRKTILLKKGAIIAVTSVCAFIILFSMFFNPPAMVSTIVGNAMVIAGASLIAISNIRSIRRFYDFTDFTNREFLQFIEKTRENQRYFYRKTQVLAFTLTSAGWLISLYEMLHRKHLLLIVVYCFAVIYLLLAWFVFRPYTYKKNSRKLNETQQNLERILNQLNNDEK